MRTYIIIMVVLVLPLLLPLLSPTVTAIGLSVGPTWIVVEDALRGVTYEKMVRVTNGCEDTATFMLFAGGGAGEWISFYDFDDPAAPIESVTIEGRGTAKVLVRFSIPEDVAVGNYTATIDVESMPGGGVESGQMGIKLRARANADIEVTGEQILTGDVISISTSDIEVNYPLRIKIVFQNTGNVMARPEIGAKITKDGALIENRTYRETTVKVASKETITVEWDTTGNEPGDYSANVTVSLGDEVLATQELPFKLLPTGTLSRQGNLTEVSYEGLTVVGRRVKVLATFINTGEIETKAKFIGDVYVDGNFVDSISSEELLVPVRETATLTAYLKIEQGSSYTIKGHVLYDGKTTEKRELAFPVETESETEPKTTPVSEEPFMEIPDCGALGAALAIASVGGYLLYRRKRSV